MKEALLDIKKELSKKLKKERFEHTIGVMYTSASLAMRYDADIEKAMTAGLLHDCGKYCSVKDQIKLCEKYIKGENILSDCCYMGHCLSCHVPGDL